MATSRRRRTEHPEATATAAAAAAVSAGRRRSRNSLVALPKLPAIELVEFCVGAVEHPIKSARIREPSHRF